MESLRDRGTRQRRLDEGLVHVFPARELGGALQDEAEYQRSGHTGLTLMKTPELRVLVEAAEAGVVLARHAIHGPATLYVVEGELSIDTPDGTYAAGAGDMVVLPREESREIVSRKRSVFLLALAPEGSAGAQTG
jgi:quercetin dioxygenase-like cupin family protein